MSNIPRYYAYDLDGKRLPNIEAANFNALSCQYLAMWITPRKSVRIITSDNIKRFKSDKCIYCGAAKSLSVVRGHKYTKTGCKSATQKILPEQFATVCEECKIKYKGLTPDGFSAWVRNKVTLITDFEQRFPGARIAMVSKSDPGHGYNVIGYMTTDEVKKAFTDGLGEIIAHSSNDSLAFVVTSKSKLRSLVTYKRKLEDYKKKQKANDQMKCIFCGNEGRQMTVDHDIPLSRGGEHEESNFCIACHTCNNDKNTMTAKEYKEYRKRKGR